MSSVRPLCRREARALGYPFPRSSCDLCHWSLSNPVECVLDRKYTLVINGPRDLNVQLSHLHHIIINQYNVIPSKIIEGGARGVDTAAHNYALNNRIELETEEALWDVYDRGAGPWRNMKMAAKLPDEWLALIKPDIPISSGTASGIAEAVRFGVNVKVVEYDRKAMQEVWAPDTLW